MISQSLSDKMYNAIMKRMKETGQAPHYTELAAEIGIPIEDARKALHDLMSVGIPGIWLFPDTDYIASFAPFSNLHPEPVEGQTVALGRQGLKKKRPNGKLTLFQN